LQVRRCVSALAKAVSSPMLSLGAGIGMWDTQLKYLSITNT
jgi:hypothetical protein